MGIVRIIAESSRFRKDRFSLRMVASAVQGCRHGPQGSRGKPLALHSLRYHIQLFVDALPSPRDRFLKALHSCISSLLWPYLEDRLFHLAGDL